MRSVSSLTAVVSCAVVLVACAAEDDAAPKDLARPIPARLTDADGEWILTFADEFDGNAVDPARWFARNGPLRHPKTLNSASAERLTVDQGSLFVSAMPTPGAEAPYAGGYLDTDGRFAQTYGKIEFRVRCQFAPGLWYAIWGRPWQNAVPEIDVEFLAENINQVWFVNHWDLPPVPADQRRSFSTVGGIDTREPHTYAITWTPEFVEWKIDGKAYERITGRGVPHEPVFWIMNLWVGGWAGEPRPETIFPSHFEVDYFRVYRPAEWQSEPSIRIRNASREAFSVGDTIDAEIADFDAGAQVEAFEGERKIDTLTKPPFKLSARKVGRGDHALTFVGTDGARRASTSVTVKVY